MVFDVSSKKSFESLHKWEKECQNFSGGEPIVSKTQSSVFESFALIRCLHLVQAIVVCGNKSDLGKKSRAVSEPEAMKWAQARGLVFIVFHHMRFFSDFLTGYTYFETSAKSGQNVNEMFIARKFCFVGEYIM